MAVSQFISFHADDMNPTPIITRINSAFKGSVEVHIGSWPNEIVVFVPWGTFTAFARDMNLALEKAFTELNPVPTYEQICAETREHVPSINDVRQYCADGWTVEEILAREG